MKSSPSPCRHRTSLLLSACCGMLTTWSVASSSRPSPSTARCPILPPRRAAAANRRRSARRDERRASRWTRNLSRGGGVNDDDDDESAGVDVDLEEEDPSSSGSISVHPDLSMSDDESSTEPQPQPQKSPPSNESALNPPIADDHPNETASSSNEQAQLLCAAASLRRAEGKILHDAGELHDASLAFREAASLLREAASAVLVVASPPPLGDFSTAEARVSTILEECATCRLHEALCLLKSGNAEGCADVCTQVLGDGVGPSGREDDHGVDQDEGDEIATEEKKTNAATFDYSYSDKHVLPSNVRARAHLRRAKARLALDDFDGALEDAKQSAFMGDRNAVAFYGRLMREGKKGAGGVNDGDSLGMGNWGDPMRGASQNSLLEAMLGGNNPFVPSEGGGSADFSSSLLASLLSNGSSSSNGSRSPGILGELLAPPPETNAGEFRRGRNKNKKKTNGIDALAKSLLSDVLKRMENEETQETICRYLRSANARQIMQYASLAGVPMKEESAQRLVRLASGITPGGIRRSISRVKRGAKVVRTLRKILKVIDKYKAVIVLMMLFLWIKSAILEPYPVDKRRAKKLAQQAVMGLVTN